MQPVPEKKRKQLEFIHYDALLHYKNIKNSKEVSKNKGMFFDRDSGQWVDF